MKGKRTVVFTPDSLRQLGQFPAYVQRMVTQGIRTHLIDNDPAEKTLKKFPLHRPSSNADYELRIAEWRIFYRIEQIFSSDSKTKITLIGEKRGNSLIVEGKEIQL